MVPRDSPAAAGRAEVKTVAAETIIRAEGENLVRRVAELERRLAAAEREAASLRESELAYRELIELSPDAIFVSDKDRWIVLINRSGVEMYGGKSDGEIVGRKASDFVHPDWHEMIAEGATGLREGIRQDFITACGGAGSTDRNFTPTFPPRRSDGRVMRPS